MPKLKRTNLSEDAYYYVKNMLLDGERYSPGDKISVEELSRELGVSRTPLWGAVNRLEAEGVVDIVPRQGVYLIKFDPAKALEVYIAREALEGMAARLAAKRISEREINTLKRSVDRQREALRNSDVSKYLSETMRFHQLIAEYSGNKVLEKLLNSIYVQMQAMRTRIHSMPTNLPQSCDDHDALIKALVDRDPDRAEIAARKHIGTLSEQIRETLENWDTLHAVSTA